MHARLCAAVAGCASGCKSATLQPRDFFVAWNGVICIVYEGFPPSLVGLKEALAGVKLSDAARLRPENFGSKWPKTSLGALRDEETTLTLEQLELLRGLCAEHGARLRGADGSGIDLRELSVVEYDARGLEAVRERTGVPLISAPAEGPSTAECERVSGVLAEWDDLAAYLPRVNAAGSRASSYRDESPHGHTLVGFLHLPDAQPALAGELARFRAAVDAALPGCYSWFSETSLHVTVRSLDLL